MTWDMDADSAFNWYNKETADTLVAAQSGTRYDPLIAIPRLVKQFASRELRLTFFVPGWVVEKYPAQIDLLVERGHEIALHGYLHERSNEIGKEDELYWFGRGLDAYKSHLGKGPRGWRAPSFAFSKHSLRALLDAGIEYDVIAALNLWTVAQWSSRARQPVEPRYRQHIAGGELVEPDPAEMAARYANATATEGRARANRVNRSPGTDSSNPVPSSGESRLQRPMTHRRCSDRAREITDLVRDTETALLFHHSSRVYYSGALTGKRRGLRIDRPRSWLGTLSL
jgi:hypothetical protein